MAPPAERPPASNRKGRSGNPAVRSGSQPPPPVTRPAGQPRPAQQRAQPTPPVAVAEPEVLPTDGAAYPLVLRGPGYQPGRSVLGVILGLSLFLLLTGVLSQAVVALGWALTAGDQPYREYVRSASAFERPIGMLGVNLGIATLIPISCLILWLVHRVHPRWLFSVGPGIRWRYLLVCLGIAVLSLNGVLLLSQLAVPGRLATGAQPGFWGFLIVIVLTSPLQAAAEEIFFRGYLMQALGSLVARPWFGVVVSSVLFALLHGTQNLPLFVDRLAFGLLAGVLVWRTGGLEAGIAAHVVNNVCAYVFAGLTTGIATLKAVKEIGWLDAAFDVGAFAVFALLAYGAFRALRMRHTVDLVGPGVAQRARSGH
jgi:membrane protease YdiL (CAAX protease family)